MNELYSWLQDHKGEPIIISKTDLATGTGSEQDTDTVHMQLHDVSVQNRSGHYVDGYVSDTKLVLEGSGFIGTDAGEENIPEQVYEILFTEDTRTEILGETITASSAGVTYTFSEDEQI
ncbi:hypothetical protein CR205_11885 [Alteribacter lacisalsi]|uniref:Uncharacterized protein n=1 Tax=Alteribacter lacisalsi TaxID=2045244 RepID=A0A2W0H5L3_9BACI|nr:hypothetical protein [Alteribacter lacisalsi]PYZ96417.1 hypothetical protein CR205_11885 [Alteribacter lacisalsi]